MGLRPQQKENIMKNRRVAKIMTDTETLLTEIENMDEKQGLMDVDDVAIVLREMHIRSKRQKHGLN